MFRSCAFCNASFDGDGGPSGLGVGRRIAFDEWKGRLWVVCPRCSRWNLTPFDDRLEHIEAVARAAATGRIAASTDQVSLIRFQQYDFVRIGKPPRVELSTWRYGERLRHRQRERMRVVVPLTIAAIGLGVAANVAAGGGFGVVIWNVHRLAAWGYLSLMGRRKILIAEPRSCARSTCSTRVSSPTRMRRWRSCSVVPAASMKAPNSPGATRSRWCVRV